MVVGGGGLGYCYVQILLAQNPTTTTYVCGNGEKVPGSPAPFPSNYITSDDEGLDTENICKEIGAVKKAQQNHFLP